MGSPAGWHPVCCVADPRRVRVRVVPRAKSIVARAGHDCRSRCAARALAENGRTVAIAPYRSVTRAIPGWCARPCRPRSAAGPRGDRRTGDRPGGTRKGPSRPPSDPEWRDLPPECSSASSPGGGSRRHDPSGAGAAAGFERVIASPSTRADVRTQGQASRGGAPLVSLSREACTRACWSAPGHCHRSCAPAPGLTVRPPAATSRSLTHRHVIVPLGQPATELHTTRTSWRSSGRQP